MEDLTSVSFPDNVQLLQLVLSPGIEEYKEETAQASAASLAKLKLKPSCPWIAVSSAVNPEAGEQTNVGFDSTAPSRAAAAPVSSPRAVPKGKGKASPSPNKQKKGTPVGSLSPGHGTPLSVQTVPAQAWLSRPASSPVSVLRISAGAVPSGQLRLPWRCRVETGLLPGSPLLALPLPFVPPPAALVTLLRCEHDGEEEEEGEGEEEAETEWVERVLRSGWQGRALVQGERVCGWLRGRPRRFRVLALDPAPGAAALTPPYPPACRLLPTSRLRILRRPFPTTAPAPHLPAACERPNARSEAEAEEEIIVGGLEEAVAAVEAAARGVGHAALERSGLEGPRGLLLWGPPGTGKTLLARRAAQVARRRLLPVGGAELARRYYGEAEARLRAAFQEARRTGALLFLDELDALCPAREHASPVERRLVGLLLREIECLPGPGLRLIAATNRPDALEPALRRPGRLDLEIEVPAPSPADRAAILAALLRRLQPAMTAYPAQQQQQQQQERLEMLLDALLRERGRHPLALRTAGFVGADLAALLREAALLGAAGPDAPRPLDEALLEAALARVRPSALREALPGELQAVSWDEVVGQEEAKARLREAVEWPLRHSEALARLGVREARGILLYGPPGCSKTMLARALASEARAAFLAVKGPELLSRWVGESERAVRDLFRRARAASPAIIFFDELDALAPHRSEGARGAADRVLSQLLAELDGLEEAASRGKARVLVVAATNRPDLLDPALLRPGRFDRMLLVAPPDEPARRQLLELQLRRVPHRVSPTELDELARLSEGRTGAELVQVCRQAALTALSRQLSAPQSEQQQLQQQQAVLLGEDLREALRTCPARLDAETMRFYREFERRHALQAS